MPQKPPIISPAHVFEGVEVSQPNAKQDLLGLSLGLRQFSLLLTLFQNWGCGNSHHLNHKDFSNVACSHSVKPRPPFLESANRQKAFQLSIIIDVLSIH